MFEDNYKNSTVISIYDLFKKLSSKNINLNSQKSMSEHMMKIQHLMQSMSDLAELILDLLQALFILCSLSGEHIQLIQQIKAMNLRDFTTAKISHLVNEAEKLKFVVAALAEVKQKSDSSNISQSSKKQCMECNKLGHEESDCYIMHPKKHS